MRGRSLVLVSLGMIAIAAVAAAHPHTYLLGNDIVGVFEDVDSDGLPDIGAVQFSPGELQPNADGNIVITLTDFVHNPVGGLLCQDLDANGVCEGAEAQAFCQSITLGPGALSPFDSVIVFIDGPISGNPLFSVCDTLSMGIFGQADHT